MTGRQEYDRNMTGRQDDRQDDRQRTLDKYMVNNQPDFHTIFLIYLNIYTTLSTKTAANTIFTA
jgi:hypothetical protein